MSPVYYKALLVLHFWWALVHPLSIAFSCSTFFYGACDLALLEVERHMSEVTSHVDRRGNEDGRMDTNRTANKPEIGERKGTLQKGGNNNGGFHDLSSGRGTGI